MNRQSHAVPLAAVATDFDKPLYIGLNLSPEITLNFMFFVDDVTNLANLLLAKFLGSNTRVDIGSRQYALTRRRTDAVDALQSHPDWFVFGKVYPGNTCHVRLSLPLLMLRVLTDNPDHTLTPDDLAFSANRLN
jgi:hypothetical protein